MTRPAPLDIAPARTLRDVTRNCKDDAALATGDPRWQDLSAARGDDAIFGLKKELADRDPARFVHAALVSHRGAGKSTEILRLTDELSDVYERVYIWATDEMDPFEIDAEDLLVNIAIAVEAHMRTLGKPLPSELLERIVKWFDEVVRTTKWVENFSIEAAAGIEGKANLPFMASLFGMLKGLFKRDSEYRTEVKHLIKKYPSTLLESVNDLLDAATERLDGRPLLIVIDNMDRYAPEVMDGLLVGAANRIRSLRCNLLLTPPISLMLQPKSEQLDSIYSCHLLFNVRLRDPGQRYDEFDGPGRDLLEAALARRIELDLLMPDRSARDRLIAASGGSIRELFELVSQAAFLSRGETIEEEDIERALRQRKQRIRDVINANGWVNTLVRLAKEHQVFDDARCLAVLFHRLAFRYNGDGWYDIHPLVAELPEFQRGIRENT